MELIGFLTLLFIAIMVGLAVGSFLIVFLAAFWIIGAMPWWMVVLIIVVWLVKSFNDVREMER